jgi:hypothetical protein
MDSWAEASISFGIFPHLLVVEQLLLPAFGNLFYNPLRALDRLPYGSSAADAATGTFVRLAVMAASRLEQITSVERHPNALLLFWRYGPWKL